jgi:hypothetical protein
MGGALLLLFACLFEFCWIFSVCCGVFSALLCSVFGFWFSLICASACFSAVLYLLVYTASVTLFVLAFGLVLVVLLLGCSGWLDDISLALVLGFCVVSSVLLLLLL